jgi:hypothetical protein
MIVVKITNDRDAIFLPDGAKHQKSREGIRSIAGGQFIAIKRQSPSHV